MSALDFGARGMAAQLRARVDRSAVLGRLQRSISRAGPSLPTVMTTPPTIGAPTGTSAITGTLFAPYSAGVATDLDKFTLMRGTWRPVNATYPQYSLAIPDAVTNGDGTAGGTGANKFDGTGGLVRFQSAAPDLEICFYAPGQANAQGFRLRVDGQYVQTGSLGMNAATNGASSFIRLTWGDGSAANRRMRVYEIEGLPQFKFGGVKSAAIYPPCAAPPIDGLNVIVHGDSFVGSTGSTAAALYPGMGSQIALLLGQPGCINSGVGATGFVANANNQRNTFIQRVQADVIARAPDVIVEMGGINDENLIGGSAATMQAAVSAWLDAVIGSLPNVLIFMTGPMTPGTPNANRLAARDGKKAAAALYPNNVVFIDNLAEAWVTGTGRTGLTKGDGNADWVTGGTDGADPTHPTDAGHGYLAVRTAQAIAARLPRG
ncbi:lysophospholipase L1-like esterase [Sphingomonas jinjuensis]|uniref:Lysophospholipase L1-like esterase n=1 Tax=Sphingomonas jinjuensis TaxID=535907 RepID=A0A840F834_9SPHN|nr:SGNH/GDSL hydrolase family protein [Sphingomonas jinjuensis]MBB4153889.1 lysophospholipase L1-like esterase [Sphingomonas jinjuensis]